MSVYLRHSLFWDVWDCYGKLMSEPQKSSMDWCSYIYIFNISPCFTMFFSMEEHLSDMSAVASTAFCSCQRLNPLWWCRAPKLLGSGTHIGDLMGRSGEWLDWARKWDEWRMMDDDGWMMDDDGWWMMMDVSLNDGFCVFAFSTILPSQSPPFGARSPGAALEFGDCHCCKGSQMEESDVLNAWPQCAGLATGHLDHLVLGIYQW